MSMQTLPHGLWPVMLNAFHEDGSIDRSGVDALTDWYIDRGSAGLFACCGSTEMFDLDDGERLDVTRRVVKRAGGRVPVVATGTFGGPVEDQAVFVKRMADTGVDAVVVIVCLLADRNEDEEILKRNMERLLELTDPVPLGLYECPTPYHRRLSPGLFGHLGETGRFLYHKDTVCDIDLLRLKIDAARNTRLGVYNAHFETGLEGASLRGRRYFSRRRQCFSRVVCLAVCRVRRTAGYGRGSTTDDDVPGAGCEQQVPGNLQKVSAAHRPAHHDPLPFNGRQPDGLRRGTDRWTGNVGRTIRRGPWYQPHGSGLARSIPPGRSP